MSRASLFVVIPIQAFVFGPKGRSLDVSLRVREPVTEEIQLRLRGGFAAGGNLPFVVELQRSDPSPTVRGHMFQASDPGDARLRLFEREFLARIAEWSLVDDLARLRDLGEEEDALESSPATDRRRFRALEAIPADFADLGTLGSLP